MPFGMRIVSDVVSQPALRPDADEVGPVQLAAGGSNHASVSSLGEISHAGDGQSRLDLPVRRSAETLKGDVRSKVRVR